MDGWGECFFEISAKDLNIAFGNDLSLIMSDFTLGILFVTEGLFGWNNVSVWWG